MAAMNSFEYRVLSGASANSLEEQVVDLVRDGFIPQGGVSVFTYLDPRTKEFNTLFSQAMVRVKSNA